SSASPERSPASADPSNETPKRRRPNRRVLIGSGASRSGPTDSGGRGGSACVFDDGLGEVVWVLGDVGAGSRRPGLDHAGRALEVPVRRPEREPGGMVGLCEAEQGAEVGLGEQLRGLVRVA